MPRIPINYQNTVIYKIVCNDLNMKELYVGHTTDFKRRKSEHKKVCVSENNKYYNLKIYRTIRENGGWDNWTMIEIEKYPCNDSKEATARERYWFEILQAKLNMMFPQRTMKEWYKSNQEKLLQNKKLYYEANKEKIKIRDKQYRENNREKISEREKEQCTCECGSIFRVKEKARHYKTQKHISFKNGEVKDDKKKYACECGSVICYDDKARHFKSTKHKLFIEEKEI